jgi:two-component system chemotaxis sensor kinase CheA
VGLDVVRRNLDELRGSLSLSSCRGIGTTFRLRLPLTLAIMDAFEIQASGTSYFVPLEAVEECLELPAATVASAARLGVLDHKGTLFAFARLHDLLGLDAAPAGPSQAILLRDHEARMALGVDALTDKRQVVVSNLGGLVPRGRLVSAATALPNGQVGLILDPPALVRAARLGRAGHALALDGTEPASEPGRLFPPNVPPPAPPSP